MDLVQFQDFLKQLVSLQAQGLDAQHLLDEAKKAGKEEALKEAASAEPVESADPVVVVDPNEGKLVMSPEELEAKLAEAKKAGSDEAIANDVTKFGDDDVKKAFEDGKSQGKLENGPIIEELKKQLSEKDADALEEAIADQVEAAVKVVVQGLRDRTVKAAPVELPAEPLPEVQA